MSAMSQQAINAYTRMDVDMAAMVASPHKLVLMLFEAAVKSVAKARLAMQKKQTKAKCDAIDRAIAIIQDGLQLSLDTKNGGELAENLNALYEYMCIQLALANARNDLAKLDEVGRMLLDFKKSWEQITPSAQQAKPVANVVEESKPSVVAIKASEKPTSVVTPVVTQQVIKASPQPVVVPEPAPEPAQQKNEVDREAPVAIVNKMLKGYAPAAGQEHSGSPMNFKA